jgi:hypothetical protein
VSIENKAFAMIVGEPAAKGNSQIQLAPAGALGAPK